MTPGIPALPAPIAPVAIEPAATPAQPPIPTLEDREFDVALELAVAQLANGMPSRTPPALPSGAVAPANPPLANAAPAADAPVEGAAPMDVSAALAGSARASRPGAMAASYAMPDPSVMLPSAPVAAAWAESRVAETAVPSPIVAAPEVVPPAAPARGDVTTVPAPPIPAVDVPRETSSPAPSVVEPTPLTPEPALDGWNVRVLDARAARPVPAQVASDRASASAPAVAPAPRTSAEDATSVLPPSTATRALPRVDAATLAAAVVAAQLVEPADAAMPTEEAHAPLATSPPVGGDSEAAAPHAVPAPAARWIEHVRAVLARVVGRETRAANLPAGESQESPMPADAKPPQVHDAVPPANVARPAGEPIAHAPALPAGDPAARTPAPTAATPRPIEADADGANERESGTSGEPGRRDTARPAATPAAPAAPVVLEAPAPRESHTTEIGAARAASADIADPGRVLARAERVTSAPAPGERVTLRFDGEGGVHGRIRLAVRGDAVHATVVPTAGFEPAGDVTELRRLLVERGFAEAHVRVQEPAAGATAGGHTSQGSGQSPREDARREAYARAHEERGGSEPHGRPGRERPRQSQGGTR